MRLLFAKLTAVSLGILAFGNVANAATIVYTSQAAFVAALTGTSYTETFSSTTGSGSASASYSGSSYGYNVTAATAANVAGTIYISAAGGFIGSNSPINKLIVTSTGNSFNAIGGNFFLTNQTDVFQASPVTITLSNGFTDTYTPTTVATFRGYISDTTITTLTMGVSPAATYNSVDNLIVSNVAPVVVPEANTMALLGLALPVIGAVVIRRKK